MGATTHVPQIVARAGIDGGSAPRHALEANPSGQPTPIEANSAKSETIAQEGPVERTTVVDQPISGKQAEGDDPVFADDPSISASRFLASAVPADEVRTSTERAAQRTTPAASTHVRSAKTSEVRRPATVAIDRDHDQGPMDGAAIDVDRGTRPMDRAESIGLEHAANSEAVVHVRIGRIDVRAAAPPPLPAPKPTQSRVESLDDYLKRTSGRR